MLEKNEEVFVFNEEEVTLDIFNYLSEIYKEEIDYYCDENDGTYHIICNPEIADDVRKQIILYAEEEMDVYLTPTQKQELNAVMENVTGEVISREAVANDTYVSAKDKYENMKSSAYSLLIVGALGLIFVGLNFAGVLSLLGRDNMLMTVTISLLLIIFIVVGLISLKNMKSIKSKIDEEKNYDHEVREYIKEKLDLSEIEKKIDGTISPEEKCIYRSKLIGEEVKKQYPKVEMSQIEYIIEDLYDTLYPDDFSDTEPEAIEDTWQGIEKSDEEDDEVTSGEEQINQTSRNKIEKISEEEGK